MGGLLALEGSPGGVVRSLSRETCVWRLCVVVSVLCPVTGLGPVSSVVGRVFLRPCVGVCPSCWRCLVARFQRGIGVSFPLGRCLSSARCWLCLCSLFDGTCVVRVVCRLSGRGVALVECTGWSCVTGNGLCLHLCWWAGGITTVSPC